MSKQPKALLLADALDDEFTQGRISNHTGRKSSAELRRLHADAEESEALRERLSTLLKRTAIALRGPEPELTSYGWHDLPERASAVVAQRDALLEALRDIVFNDPYSQSSAGVIACAAIKAVEKGK